MSRTLRRLFAGTVLLGTLTTLAPQAQASCFKFRAPDGTIWVVCI